MRKQQVSGISDVSWSKSNVPDSFYRLSNTCASHEKRVQDLLLVSIMAELSLLIGGCKWGSGLLSSRLCFLTRKKHRQDYKQRGTTTWG